MAKQSLNLPYLLLSGVSLVVIIASFVMVRPLLARWQAAQAQVQQVQTIVRDKQEFLLSIDRKKAELAGQQAQEKQLAVVLPVEASLDDVARILHKAAEASGVVITRLNNSGAGEAARLKALRARGEASDIPSNVAPIGLEVQVAGTYQQVRQFIERVEHSPRLIDLVSLKINRNTSNIELLNVDLRVRLYEHETGA